MKSVALITGASGGIGLELAKCFAADHHDVVLVARSRDRLEALAQELRDAYHVNAEVIVADLADRNAPTEILATLGERNLHVEFLINNAGFGTYGNFIDTAFAEEVDELQVNIVALTALTKLLLPGMVEQKNGRILNVASTAAFQPGPFMAVYCATKAYVLSLSEALAVELRGTGVSVTCLCPGPTETAFGDRAGFKMASLAQGKIPSAEAVARFGYAALFAGEMVAVHGLGNRLLTASSRFAPRSVVAGIAGKILSTGKGSKN